MKASEIVLWSADNGPAHRTDTPLRCTLRLSGLYLRPNWYRLCVWVDGSWVRVSARAGFADPQADLRMHLERHGQRRMVKIFKVSEPLASIDIAAEGEQSETHIERIEIRPMRRWSVFAFLAGKGLRYAIINRNRLDWAHAWNHFRAALRPRASFAFQGRYGGNHPESYARWQALHENSLDAELIARNLRDTLAGATLRIALLAGDGIGELQARRFAQTISARAEGLTAVVLRPPQWVEIGAQAPPAWDFVLPLDRDGTFAEAAVDRMLLTLLEAPAAQAVFADSDTVGADGVRRDPLLKPPLWDAELLWSSDYVRAPVLLRWNAQISAALQWPGATVRPSYALALLFSGLYRRDQLRHLPAVLFHEAAELDDGGREALKRRQAETAILKAHLRNIGHPHPVETRAAARRVTWPVPEGTRVSIIIPSKDNPGLLDTCIQSIRSRTIGLEPEIIVADNGSVKPATRAYLRQLELDGIATVIPCPGPFNFSKINNDARHHATGDILVFLNDDTRVRSPEWLLELAGLAARPTVGAVGALLLYPDGTVQHGGVLLGIRGIADHAFRHESGESRGYLDLLRCRREVTAVTGACLAVSAAHFGSVGGFDEALAVTANDIDLCLRLNAQGLTTIWSPWCVLEHAESKSRGVDSTDSALDRQRQETRIFSARWGHLLNCDATYNPGLSRIAPDFSLGVE